MAGGGLDANEISVKAVVKRFHSENPAESRPAKA
jgi:hypothetical protein